MISESILVTVLAVIALVVLSLVGLTLTGRHRLRQVQQQQQEMYERLAQLAQQHELLLEQVHEVHTGAMGVGTKVGELARQLQQTQYKQEQLEDQEPELRLYSKATRMAAQGANADDIVEACELPRAEAELLVSLHQRPE